MQNKSLEGGCICGQVRYKLTEKPLFTQACHCKDCKILTGSSYVINSSVLENTLSVDGNVSSSVELKGGSGKPNTVYFCERCGTYLYNTLKRLYFESGTESKVNQNVNIQTTFCMLVDNLNH